MRLGFLLLGILLCFIGNPFIGSVIIFLSCVKLEYTHLDDGKNDIHISINKQE